MADYDERGCFERAGGGLRVGVRLRGRCEKTSNDSSDGSQLLRDGIGLHAEVFERGRAQQITRILRGEDDRTG